MEQLDQKEQSTMKLFNMLGDVVRKNEEKRLILLEGLLQEIRKVNANIEALIKQKKE